MAKICNRSFLFVSLLVFLTATVAMASLGAPKDVSLGDGGHENSLEIEELGKFAVDEHNKKENALLEFGKVVKAKTQVVAGTMYHLTLEAIEGGKKKFYEAKVWVKPWMHFKELQEFKHVNDCITSSDLGAKQDH